MKNIFSAHIRNFQMDKSAPPLYFNFLFILLLKVRSIFFPKGLF
ncbi:hypothetical protein CAEBREN_24613 [Caenorhabditis brenneri]|uniref:Uncharacterized protein n=1 Tax=Caenorhabditis brenneri TaxID=135651 RepID=G0N3H3_CAEBE|nr:hypothetical protein CAEBREN_24613 [Caenorhabditis brenneri]